MAVCASCAKPLRVQIEVDEESIPHAGGSSVTEEGEEEEVPDDVQLLGCGCHFHWQCLLEAYEVIHCPHCSKALTSTNAATNEAQILCNVRNEGGVQESLDILPLLTEELYLKAYPEDRKPRAFLQFCGEGDVEAIVELLQSSSEDDDEEEDEMDDYEQSAASQKPMDVDAILRYQDPIGDMRSALHIAVVSGRAEVVWLLLLLASTLDPSRFPQEVQAAALQLGLARDDQRGKVDIRSLQDGHGRTAVHYVQDTLNFDARLLHVG